MLKMRIYLLPNRQITTVAFALSEVLSQVTLLLIVYLYG